jgi:hypothetical protein
MRLICRVDSDLIVRLRRRVYAVIVPRRTILELNAFHGDTRVYTQAEVNSRIGRTPLISPDRA